jgi:hypothetical protein
MASIDAGAGLLDLGWHVDRALRSDADRRITAAIRALTVKS